MSHKKIILVTLFDDNNIGNRLQNYALQHVLNKKNFDVDIIDNHYTTKPTNKEKIKILVKCLLELLGVKKYKGYYIIYRANLLRRKANEKFDQANLNNVIVIENEKTFQTDWSKYDIAIAGSDQIWHKWRNDKYELPFYYLEFMPQEKRTSYAASFGFEKIPDKDEKQHEEGLKNMAMISCREESGCRIVKQITGRDVPRVLDPTLLMSASEWRCLEAESSAYVKAQTGYAFLYFLGNKTQEYTQEIKSTIEKKGISRFIDFSDLFNKDIMKSGPCDFITLIDHADYVFTDSFHCCVFSIIFNKQFTVFKRKQEGFEKMFGRIEDLLASTGRLECIYGGTLCTQTNDFSELWENSMKYLDKLIGIVE